jgi:putative transposase
MLDVWGGIPYHVTQRGTDLRRVFFLNSDREMHLRLLSRNLSWVRVLACALMTNHIHAVMIPERADSLAVLFRCVHGRRGSKEKYAAKSV